MGKPANTVEGIMARLVVDRDSGCWLWPAGTNKDGYPVVRYLGKTRKVYRLVYTWLVGASIDGLDLHHEKCRNRRCCNPQHVQPMSRRDHAKQHKPHLSTCVNGHEYTADNAYFVKGKRYCRECHRASDARRYSKIKETRNDLSRNSPVP